MAPNRFRRDAREKRESTPFAEEPISTVFHNTAPPEIPAEWRDIEAPINFTWVGHDELAGMGWPKSRDQVRFLVQQGIDHLVTLSSDKLPPHYAFPDLKWTMIPVEDFTGPTIGEIKKFISIMDDARKDGEAVGVHCAEGRGRTGVMCACYLIYYHDISPWDAIRIMRRQRPGSVERKIQEETVVTFGKLLQDYGKSTLEQLEQKEKELKELQKKQQEHSENLLLLHTATFYGPAQRKEECKNARLERMRRSRSMPKINQDEEILEETVKEEINFRKHMQNFFHDNVGRCRSQPRDREKNKSNKNTEDEETEEELQRDGRAITPGRSLLLNLKPVGTTRPKKAEVHKQSKLARDSGESKNEYNKHFKSFMSTTTSVKRVRSFSQTRDKEVEETQKYCKTSDIKNKENVKEVEKDVYESVYDDKTMTVKIVRKSATRKPSFEKKCVEDMAQKENQSKELKEDNVSTDHSVRKEKDPSPMKEDNLSRDHSVRKEKGSSPMKKDNLSRDHSVRKEKATSPSASECSMASTLSSMSKEYNVISDKPIVEQDNKDVESNRVRRISSDSTKELPPPPTSKPKCSVDESTSSNYDYYVRIRSRASSKHDCAIEDTSTPSEEASKEEEEKKDLGKDDENINSNNSTPKTKTKTRSRATSKKSELVISTDSKEKSNLLTSEAISSSQTKASEPVEEKPVKKSKIVRKKPRSKTLDKNMVVKEPITKNNSESNDMSRTSDVAYAPTKETVTKNDSEPNDISQTCDVVCVSKKETVDKKDSESNDICQKPNVENLPPKEPEKEVSPAPKKPECKTIANGYFENDPFLKMIYADDTAMISQSSTKLSANKQGKLGTATTSNERVNISIPKEVTSSARDMSSEKSDKTMVAARTSLLQPKTSNSRRRSSNPSNKGCSSVEVGSDNNNNDTTPRPSPCKYAGSLSNSSIPSSPNSSATTVNCSTVSKDNENILKTKRKRATKIYDRSDSNSSYKANGCCSTLAVNEVENNSNENLNKERKRSLSKGVDNNNSSNYTTYNNDTAIKSTTTSLASSNQINSMYHTASATISDSSSLNSTATSFHDNDKEKSERRQRTTYRRSRTGPIADLKSESNDNHKSNEDCHKKEMDNNLLSTSTTSRFNSSLTNTNSSVTSSTTNEKSSKYEAPSTPKTKSRGTLHYSTYRMSYGMRAKSECNLTEYDNSINDNDQYRSTEDNSRDASSAISSRDSNTYGLSHLSSNRENQFLASAKRWASYDKTPYVSPFARDSWKRTNKKFNYSRFLNYTRETFV